eukprot:5571939-Pyramimonas_sp.AAC.2
MMWFILGSSDAPRAVDCRVVVVDIITIVTVHHCLRASGGVVFKTAEYCPRAVSWHLAAFSGIVGCDCC